MPTLELVKTRLRIEDQELQQLNANGGLLLRVPLAEVTGLEFRKVVEPFGLAFFTIGLGLWCVGHFVCENNVLKTLIFVGAVLVAGFGLLGVLGDRILVRTRDNQVLLECPDQASEGQAFVLSVNRLLRERAGAQA